ncbi:uncharacterized protein LOC112895037 isoform X2 [Panicum hallii]|uniref:uncharacterized protein LOC112895037 isoform X2 n=1 Tax=Panicum hallii TaxID=206008 RepID=UPI000DF4DE6E|nr:uncharacterized protein LOC112895037 isoform X2 [Panicum hallii]
MLDGFIDRDDGFTIAAPHLIHFECLGCPLEYICWRERPSLESAHIDTCGPTFDDQSDFTGILSCAKTLTLLNFQGSDVKLSPRLKKLTLVQRQLPKEANGARIDAMPINEMALQCPLLETVIIRCSKDDGEIHIMVNAMVANGVSMEKINVKFYEDMVEKVVGEIISLRHE